MRTEDLQKKLKFIANILFVFRQAKKDNGETFIKEINMLSQDQIQLLIENYGKSKLEKINKIRMDILEHIKLGNVLTINDLENFKKEERKKYDHDVFRSRKHFSILYILYYFQYKKDVVSILKEINKSLITDM